MGKTYNKVFEYRQKFDYIDFSTPSRDLVIEYLEKLKEFRSEIDQYIQKQIAKWKNEFAFDLLSNVKRWNHLTLEILKSKIQIIRNSD